MERKSNKKLLKDINNYRNQRIKENLDRLDDIEEYIDRMKYTINHWDEIDPNFKPRCTKNELVYLLVLLLRFKRNLRILSNHEIDEYIDPENSRESEIIFDSDMPDDSYDYAGVFIGDSLAFDSVIKDHIIGTIGNNPYRFDGMGDMVLEALKLSDNMYDLGIEPVKPL